MKKSGFAVLFLCMLLLLLAALPMQEAQAGTAISSVSVTITAPASGAKPSYSPSISSGSHCSPPSYTQDSYKNGVSWYDSAEGFDLEPGVDTFKSGHYYGVTILLSSQSGYDFSYDMTVKVNGNTPSWSINDNGYLEIYYTFPEIRQSISSVSLTFQAPTAGACPDYSPVLPSGAHYMLDSYYYDDYVSDVAWYDATENFFLNPGKDKCKAGHEYEVSFYLIPKNGYTFSEEITAKINGHSANYDCSSDWCFVCYTFSSSASPTPTLTSVSFSKSTATVGQNVTITAVSSTSAAKLSMYNGSTLAKSWTSGYTDSGETRTWKVTYAFVAEGAKTLTFKGSNADGTFSAGKTASITITAKPTISSVSFSKTKATVGQSVSITAKTSTKATKLNLYSGSTLVKSWTSGYTDSGSTRTWKVTYAFTTAGNRTVTFKAADANGALSAGKTASITITARPTISSVSFSKSKATVGQIVTITAKTSTNATKLNLYSGSTLVQSWTAVYTDSGSTRTWKVSYAFTTAGNRTVTFKVNDANGGLSAGKTASITITARPAVSSVSFSKTKATVGQNVTITAKTSTTVTKLSMYNGSTLAKTWTSGYTDSGTTRTWKVTYAFVSAGAKTLTFKGTDTNGAVSSGKTAGITITAKPTVSSVSFSKSTASVGQSVTITAKTSTTVTKLSMYNGSALAKSWTSGYTDSGTTRTWKVTYAFVAAGAKTLTFRGIDANGVVSAGKTASITITK